PRDWSSDVCSSDLGPIADTEGMKRLIAASVGEQEHAARSVPLHRLGSQEDIANLALFLGSPYAGYISGTVIPCDGGGALESVKPALEAAGRASGFGGRRTAATNDMRAP